MAVRGRDLLRNTVDIAPARPDCTRVDADDAPGGEGFAQDRQCMGVAGSIFSAKLWH